MTNINTILVYESRLSCIEAILDSRPLDKSVLLKINFLIFQPKHVVGSQKNRLIETVLLSTHNKC